jgi:two-component system, chemotaxis family, sensor kinase CheA
MQYRGSSLPLVTLADAAKVNPIPDGNDLAVIVSTLYGREVGLLVAMPVDVHETNSQIDSTTHRQPGVSGSAIIRGETTLLVDFMELVNAVYPEWHEATVPEVNCEKDCAVLLAEDSDFFRAQVKRFLEADGYRVLDAPDGEDAWKLLLDNLHNVRLLVTDIEMPRLSGLQLSARVRADQRTRNLPIIAISSLAGDEDIVKAKAAGVSDYQIKLDRDGLLDRVRQLLRASPVTSSLESEALQMAAV